MGVFREKLILRRDIVSGRGCPHWNGSEAKRLFKIDIDNAFHLEMTAGRLQQSRDECQAWPAEVLRATTSYKKKAP